MLPDRYHYIAILEYSENGTIGVYFPDLPGCVSAADTTEKAIENAKEALSLHLYGMEEDGEDIPAPSDLMAIELDKGEIPTMIEVFMKPFREKMHTRYVKKTLSIPNWLNTAAEAQHINFSAVLQSALMEQLHIEQ